MLGGMLASRSDRLLALSSMSLLPESWRGPAKIFCSRRTRRGLHLSRMGQLGIRALGTRVRQLSASRRTQVDRARHHAGRLRASSPCAPSGTPAQPGKAAPWPRSDFPSPRCLGFVIPPGTPCILPLSLAMLLARHHPRAADLRRLRRPGAACCSGTAARPPLRSPWRCTAWWPRRCCPPSRSSLWPAISWSKAAPPNGCSGFSPRSLAGFPADSPSPPSPSAPSSPSRVRASPSSRSAACWCRC